MQNNHVQINKDQEACDVRTMLLKFNWKKKSENPTEKSPLKLNCLLSARFRLSGDAFKRGQNSLLANKQQNRGSVQAHPKGVG